MRVALVHDYIKEYGGAERVLEALREIWPDAPVYTTVYLPEFLGPHKDRFKEWDIRTSWLQHVPFKAKLISPFRLIAPLVFKQFDFSGYDVVIVSATGAYTPNVINKKSSYHVCYCHTPPRYLYGYMTAREWKDTFIFRVLGELANHFLRMVDYTSSQSVDLFIANSEEVKARIKKFYRKDAVVIYPPIDAGAISHKEHAINSRSYYLSGGRLARAKGIEVIFEAFKKNGKQVKIFGKAFAGFGKKVANIKHTVTNVDFLGEVNDKEKFDLMKGAKAFINASFDEDFGITPVEAMSAGAPVIAYKSGGVQETVIDGKTGIFYSPNTSLELNKAIEQFERMSIDPKDCMKQAKKFSKERFETEVRNLVKSVF